MEGKKLTDEEKNVSSNEKKELEEQLEKLKRELESNISGDIDKNIDKEQDEENEVKENINKDNDSKEELVLEQKEVKMDTCSEKKHYGIFYWIIVVLGITFIIYMSIDIGKKIGILISGEYRGNISNEEISNSNATKDKINEYDYSDFLKSKSYLVDTANWATKPYGYYTYDINKDGTKELFIVSKDDDSSFFYTAIYTYIDNQVILVSLPNLKTYGYVLGDNVDKGVVYALTRTTAHQNYYVLYKLEDNQLVVDDSVSFETGDSRIITFEPTKLP